MIHACRESTQPRSRVPPHGAIPRFGSPARLMPIARFLGLLQLKTRKDRTGRRARKQREENREGRPALATFSSSFASRLRVMVGSEPAGLVKKSLIPRQ
jgi:hypothetical protein